MSPATPWLATPLLVLGLPACEERLPEFRYETEHLRIATAFDEPLCRGDLDRYESVITTLEAVLDTSVVDRTDVYMWDLTMDEPGWCSLEYVVGCYQDGVVYADQMSITHELVHVIVASIGSPADFWNIEPPGTSRAGCSRPTGSISIVRFYVHRAALVRRSNRPTK